MILRNLTLENFRNYRKQEFDFTLGITILVGPNAIGKTNIMEGLFLLAHGSSFRASLDGEMINSQNYLGRVKGKIDSDQETKLEIILTTNQEGAFRSSRKRYLVNGIGRRKMDFIGNLRLVYFGPQDLELILGSPSKRRDYLDFVLEGVDSDYRRALLSYRKGLRQRNRLLEQIREGQAKASALFFWDKLLLENGNLLSQKRRQLIDFFNQKTKFKNLTIGYLDSPVSVDRLAEKQIREIAAGKTLIGPHRDDFKVAAINGSQNERDLHKFGSRGEQRLAVLALKLVEVDFIVEQTDSRPLLLLDDIFSELDHQHRKDLLELIPKQQTILTTSDIHLIEPVFRKKATIVRLGASV